MLEGPGGGVHGGDAGTDVAGEVLKRLGGVLQAVEKGFGGGIDELALEVAEGEDGGVHVAAVCLGEGGVETEGVALGYGIADIGQGLLFRLRLPGGPIYCAFLHLYSVFVN